MFKALEDEEFEEFDFNLTELTRAMDIAKSEVFAGKSSAFFGPLMCSLNFIWTKDFPTAATDGVSFFWNPVWFMWLKPANRVTVIMHELWHVARLHMVRLGTKDPKIWNIACDIRINNDLQNAGYTFEGMFPPPFDSWLDQSYGLQPEEDIYDDLMSKSEPPPVSPWDPDGAGDMLPDISDAAKQAQINKVIQATNQAKIAGKAGDIPGDIEDIVKQFLAPIIAWEILLHRFFQDMIEEGYTWSRPNRRYAEMYLPDRDEDDGRLEHLIYYLDVSGSVTDAQVLRFNSEVKYIKEIYNPKKLTLVQFDHRITSEKTFLEEDSFDEVVVVGRGGTHFEPVRQHMIDHKPTCAVIFSDMYCEPMQPLPFDIPIIWVAIGNRGATVPFGEIVYIKG